MSGPECMCVRECAVSCLHLRVRSATSHLRESELPKAQETSKPWLRPLCSGQRGSVFFPCAQSKMCLYTGLARKWETVLPRPPRPGFLRFRSGASMSKPNCVSPRTQGSKKKKKKKRGSWSECRSWGSEHLGVQKVGERMLQSPSVFCLSRREKARVPTTEITGVKMMGKEVLGSARHSPVAHEADPQPRQEKERSGMHFGGWPSPGAGFHFLTLCPLFFPRRVC